MPLAQFLALTRSCFLVAALTAALPADAQQRNAASHAPPAELDAYTRQAVRDWGLPGVAVAAVRGDSVLFVRGYGVREIGGRDSVDEHTAFDAASLSKSFTATIVAMLVDEGRMRWDAPVRTYLPELAFSDPYLTANVTIRDLLAHRTGLKTSNAMWRITGHPRDEVLRRVRFIPVQSPFRTSLIYSNVGYAIAGEASARAAGQPWETLVRARILDPLGMRDSFLWSEWAAHEGRGANVASAHTVIGGVHQVVDRRDGTPERDGRNATAPAGSVQSSAWDLARWMRFHLTGGRIDGRKLVSDSALHETWSPQVLVPTTAAFREARQLRYFAAYGMGWQVWDYRGHPLLWHSGSGNGQLAYMALLPRDSLGVVVLVNTWRSPFIHGSLAARIIDHYLGEPTRDYSGEALRADSAAAARAAAAPAPSAPAPARAFARPLAAYSGVYTDPLHGEVTVRAQGDQLILQVAQGQVADLHPQRGDTVRVRWRTPLFAAMYTAPAIFTPETGRVQSLTLPVGRDTIRASRR